MRISKYLHSCLVLEEGGERLLFDPGRFSFIEGRVAPEQFADVTHVVITHDHPDHLDPDALRRIVALSGAPVYAGETVVPVLAEAGIAATALAEGTHTVGACTLQAITVPHEPILADALPPITAVLVNDRVLNPGDSFAPALERFAGVEVLVLPVMAPFLTEVGAVDFARRMRPAHIVPVHDSYARPFFQELRYAAFGPWFARLGIEFHALAEPGASMTI